MMPASRCLLALLAVAATLLPIALGCASTVPPGPPPPPSPGASDVEWQLVWHEEFNGPDINTDTWTFETFPGVDSGNRELQHYTDRSANAAVQDGVLAIRALREDYKGHEYTSARIKTSESFAFRYGRVEARIRIPSTKGIWPAFWMMPRDSVYGQWPHSGEIDIMESVNTADETYGTIHFGAPHHVHTGGVHRFADGRLHSEDFHIYAIEWEPHEIRWYVDGVHYSTKDEWTSTKSPFPAPFNQDFYLILNVAVGGNWPGPPDETSEFPQAMLVDWIRVYQVANDPPRVDILSPVDGARVPAGEAVPFAVHAHDPDGTISRVDLVRGSQVLATDDTPPYRLLLPPLEDGCHEGIAVYAYDNTGASARVDRMLVAGTGCPQGPYGGTPHPLPGTIQAEHFDEGWRGEAYYDYDRSNNGGHLRPDTGVDIGAYSGGYYVGWTEPGEWIEYTVAVQDAGPLRARAHVAAGLDGGTFTITAPGQDAGEISFAVDSTGNWAQFVDVQGEGALHLPPGNVVLRVTFVDGGVNLAHFEFTPPEG